MSVETRGQLVRASGPGRVRLAVAQTAGRLAAFASRVSGRGSGASIRGMVMMRLDPGALGKLLRGRRVLAVSGTNGKTTTTHFLAAAIRAALGADAARVVSNADGANLHHGIASALGEQPKSDIAVLEVDERVVADVLRLGRPEVLVLLNFSRDQLDRHHEIKGLARSWREALAEMGEDGPVVVANAEEPLVVWAARPAKQVIWVDTQSTWSQDAALCPECGSLLTRTDPEQTDGGAVIPGHWECTGCELAEPPAEVRVAGDRIIDRQGRELTTDLQVPGKFNIGNAACALAAAEAFGVDSVTALSGMRRVTAPAGRFSVTTIAGTPARLMLSKNPAGWAESLPLATTDPVVLAIDAVAADGKDLSWLWDVEFEQLQGRTVVCTGPRASDLAVRLSYAGVDHEVLHDLTAAFRSVAGRVDGPIDVVSTYTPFQRLLDLGGVQRTAHPDPKPKPTALPDVGARGTEGDRR
ncbi:MurT ligase domain-containing protein [Enemella sp. A6]|uniref:DUF1727 domain-containing protein n=1 Tax=Enemella sp. A6 TaxID=3440152 RepID=UPI003EB93BB4